MINRQTKKKTLPGLVLAGSLMLAVPLLSGCGSGPDTSEALSHITRAETYTDQGQFRSALLEIRNAIQKDPNNVDHIVYLADLYLQLGAAKEAAELLAPWVQEEPNKVGLLLARAYVEQGKHLSASETLALQSPDSPEDQLEAALIRAEALRKSGQAAEALALFNSLTTSNGSSVPAINGLLQAQIDLGKNEQAVEAADNWLAKNPVSPEVLYWKGQAQYQLNQLDQASATLTDALGKLPASDIFLPIRRNMLTTLSRVLTEQGKITEAQIYNRILAENINSSARDQAEAAVAALKEGDFEKAKALLRDTLKLDPENEQVALMLGAISAGTGDMDEGARLLKEHLDPETTPVQFIRAATMAQIDTGDREDALKTLARAIEARPNDNELLAMHGILALSLPGNEKSGIASLSKAISNEPDNARLRLALARHYLQKDQPEQALGQLRMAFTSNPSDWMTTSTYLDLLVQQGEDKEAGEVRDSLLDSHADQPRAVLLASLTDARLGETDAAEARLERLTKQNPELQDPKILLANLYARSGKRNEAVALLVEAAIMNPDAIGPLQQASQVYMQDHTTPATRDWLAGIGKTHPELKRNTDILNALIALTQGELASARSALSQWLDTDSIPAKRAYGQLLLAEARVAAKEKDWAKARAKAAEAIALEPENIGFALLPAGIAQMEGKLDDAFAALESVEKTHGEQPATILSRTRLLQQQQGAEAAYRYLSETWQSTGDLRLMPSLLALAQDSAPDSIDNLTNLWVQQTPDDLTAHMARANWLLTNNQEPAAALHYEKVISKQPHNVAALNNLAWTLRKENPERALELAKQASKLAPNNPAVLDTYGWILHLSGNHSQAKALIEKALQLAPPGSTDIEEHLKAVKDAL